MINRFFAFILLIILTPLFLLIFLLIFLDDGLPILFFQKRFTDHSNTFHIYKFRTMKIYTPNVATHLLTNQEIYITRMGKFLRKYSLDEIPNLINVVKGEMVLVGPRPALYNQDDLMELRVATGVHILKPGITGWAQINGRDNISIERKVQLEQEYLKKKSFLFDLEIMIKTFTNVLFSKGVSH
jgi:O-antigen biosynthesis protein WbqP